MFELAARLFHRRRCLVVSCLPSPDTSPSLRQPVRSCSPSVHRLPAAEQYAEITVQALYQARQLPVSSAVGVLFDPKQSLAATASSSCTEPKAASAPQHAASRRHIQGQQSRLPQLQPINLEAASSQHKAQARLAQLRPTQVQGPWQKLQRPVHVPGQWDQVAQQLRGCRSLQQLQNILQPTKPQLPPSCLAVAMQQLALLHQEQQQHEWRVVVGRRHSGVASSDSNNTAAWLSQSLVQQLPAASAQAITYFLAAAAAGGFTLPDAVLQQLASDLVHRALHAACHKRQHQQSLQQQQQRTAAHSQAAILHQKQLSALSSASVQRQHVTVQAAWALAKLQLKQPAVWAELASLAGEQLEQFTTQDCVQLFWSLARARHYEPRLYHKLLKRLSSDAAGLSPDSIGCILWACAHAGHYNHSGISALVLAAAGSMEQFSPRALSSCLWACVSLRHYEPRLLRAARVRALARMQQFEPHSLAMVMCSLAKFGVQDEQLTAAIAGRARQCVTDFTMQGLANMAWAVAKLQQVQGSREMPSKQRRQGQTAATEQYVHQQLLADICVEAVSQLAAAKPQEVCNLLWACAIMKHRNEQCLEAAHSRLVAVAEDATAHDLAQAVWALEVLKHRRAATHSALTLQALNKLHMFGPQALSNYAWAVMSSGMQLHTGLPAAVARQFQVLLPQLTPQGVATILWALSKMGRGAVTPQVMHAASSHILANIACYNAQDLCNIAMVCCKAGYKDPTLLQGLGSAASNAAATTLQLLSGRSSNGGMACHSAAGSSFLQGRAVARAPAVGRQASDTLATAARSALQSKELTAQGVCNLVWAFAGLGWHDPLLMQQLQQLAAHLIQQKILQPRTTAGLLQGFALLGESCDSLFTALAATSERKSMRQSASSNTAVPVEASFWQQEADNALAITAATQAQHEQQVQKWQKQFESRRWPADALSLVVWAAAVTAAHHTHPGYVQAALQQLHLLGVSSLTPARRAQLHLALVSIATDWGLVTWGNVCGLSWGQSNSTGSTNHKHQPQQTDKLTSGAREVQHVAVVHSIQMAVPAKAAALLLSSKLVRQCAAAWRQEEASSMLNQTEEEVAQALQSMGLQPLVQRWIQPLHSYSSSAAAAAGLAHVDGTHHMLHVRLGVAGASLGPGRRPVLIEVLHPAAVSSSWPSRVLGKTSLKQQCVKAAGWDVAMLTCQEWKGLGQDRAAQRQLLSRLLQLSFEGFS